MFMSDSTYVAVQDLRKMRKLCKNLRGRGSRKGPHDVAKLSFGNGASADLGLFRQQPSLLVASTAVLRTLKLQPCRTAWLLQLRNVFELHQRHRGSLATPWSSKDESTTFLLHGPDDQ